MWVIAKSVRSLNMREGKITQKQRSDDFFIYIITMFCGFFFLMVCVALLPTSTNVKKKKKDDKSFFSFLRSRSLVNPLLLQQAEVS